jgi:hypothetical protein
VYVCVYDVSCLERGHGDSPNRSKASRPRLLEHRTRRKQSVESGFGSVRNGERSKAMKRI